jgi:hypothetical protein
MKTQKEIKEAINVKNGKQIRDHFLSEAVLTYDNSKKTILAGKVLEAAEKAKKVENKLNGYAIASALYWQAECVTVAEEVLKLYKKHAQENDKQNRLAQLIAFSVSSEIDPKEFRNCFELGKS